MTWLIAIIWTVSLIITGKFAYRVGWAHCLATLERFIKERKEDE